MRKKINLKAAEEAAGPVAKEVFVAEEISAAQSTAPIINNSKSSRMKNILKFRPSKKVVLLAVAFILGFGTHYLVQDFKISSVFNGGIDSATEKFSIMGTVKEISGSKITIEKSAPPKDGSDRMFTFKTKYIEKVETNRREAVKIEGIKVGDRIIAQGVSNKEKTAFFVKNIISLASQPSNPSQNPAPKPEVSTTTPATTTETE